MGIKFGTSGWRGLIARDFTFDNVRIATQAIAQYLLSLNPAQKAPAAKTLILGYDTRFLGREFSLAAAEVLASNGLTPLLCIAIRPLRSRSLSRPTGSNTCCQIGNGWRFAPAALSL